MACLFLCLCLQVLETLCSLPVILPLPPPACRCRPASLLPAFSAGAAWRWRRLAGSATGTVYLDLGVAFPPSFSKADLLGTGGAGLPRRTGVRRASSLSRCSGVTAALAMQAPVVHMWVFCWRRQCFPSSAGSWFFHCAGVLSHRCGVACWLLALAACDACTAAYLCCALPRAAAVRAVVPSARNALSSPRARACTLARHRVYPSRAAALGGKQAGDHPPSGHRSNDGCYL